MYSGIPPYEHPVIRPCCYYGHFFAKFNTHVYTQTCKIIKNLKYYLLQLEVGMSQARLSHSHCIWKMHVLEWK